ncbi:hypothetical protein EXY23_11450 [Roseicella aquatilis]|uniref:Uncharacterized protein n=2 Tax=Roseicella aquatilis TaxID=2527868 RepID=A0A4R4DN72_9PROT|nr:hypothetical protein EXY23_11450 [Roseicella aquatilis]
MLGLGMLLSGCATYDRSTTWLNNRSAAATDRVADAGAAIGAPWGRSRPTLPEDSTTIARVAGQPVAVTTLQPEPGDVWPVPESPRTTLANPDAAMRNIPTYKPGDFQTPSAPVGRSEWQPTDPVPAAPLPPGLRGRPSSPPPPPLRQPEPQANFLAPPGDTRPPPRGAEGRVILTPQGQAVTGGGTDRVQSFIGPNGQTGTAVIDGNTTTLFSPDGRIQTVPTPR